MAKFHNRCLPSLDDQSTYLQFGVLPINSIVHIKQGGGYIQGGVKSFGPLVGTLTPESLVHNQSYETFHSAFTSQLNQWVNPQAQSNQQVNNSNGDEPSSSKYTVQYRHHIKHKVRRIYIWKVTQNTIRLDPNISSTGFYNIIVQC